MKYADAKMKKLARKCRRNTDSSSDGIKELVERARSATPLNLVREKKMTACSDSGRNRRYSTDEITSDPVRSNEHLDHGVGPSSIMCEAAQSDSRSELFDAHQWQNERTTATIQSSCSSQQINENGNNTNNISRPSLSPAQNEIYMFPSNSSPSLDALSPHHQQQRQKSLSMSSRKAETVLVASNKQPNSGTKRGVPAPSQLKRRDPSNCALETTNDKIDEDMLSAWWFLGSKSGDESVSSESKKNVSTTSKTKMQNASDEKIRLSGSSSATKRRRTGSISTWVMRSFSSEKVPSRQIKHALSSSSSNTLEMPPQSCRYQPNLQSKLPVGNTPTPRFAKKVKSFTTNKQSKSRNYTRKEMAKRREWVVGLGGTVNYDQPHGGDCESVASYQLFPPQTGNLRINTSLSIGEDPSKSPDWDPSMLPKRKLLRFEGWTPQDSSYGAAVPLCGYIPKRTRKLIEIIFFLVLSALIIYLVVKLGIKLTEHEHQSSAGGLDLDDDDHYIANNNVDVDDDTNDDVYDGRLRRRRF